MTGEEALRTMLTEGIGQPGRPRPDHADPSARVPLAVGAVPRRGPATEPGYAGVAEGPIPGEMALLGGRRRASRVTAVTEMRGLRGGRVAFSWLLAIGGVPDRVVTKARPKGRHGADFRPAPVRAARLRRHCQHAGPAGKRSGRDARRRDARQPGSCRLREPDRRVSGPRPSRSSARSCHRPRGTRDHAALRAVASSMLGMGVCRSSRKSVTLG